MFVVVGWVGVTKYMCVCMSPLPAAIKGKRGKKVFQEKASMLTQLLYRCF